MMPNLKLEKKKLELLRVGTAKAEMKFKILERLEDVDRLKANIVIQEKREQELKEEIKGEDNG